jgi:signal transduction histidine kinase
MSRLDDTRSRGRTLADRAERLQDVTRAFAEALTPEQVHKVVVERVLPAFDADGGSLALLSGDAEFLEVVWVSGIPEEKWKPFARVPVSAQLPGADAVRARAPSFLETREVLNSRYPHVAGQNMLSALVSLPLLVARRCYGVLEAAWRRPRTFEPEDRDFAVALAQQCAQAMDRAAAFEGERIAREKAEAAEQRLAFLSEASHLLSSSLDRNKTLYALADLAVPRLAECCVIELVDEMGIVDRLRIAHTDPVRQRALAELYERFPADAMASYGMAMVQRSGQSQLWDDISEDMLRRYARSDEHFRLLQSLGLRSIILVPLKTADRVAGVITLIASSRRFGHGDLQLAEELGVRAALAVENALLFDEAQAAIRRRDDFLSVASHELRTPVTSIELNVSAILRRLQYEPDGAVTKERFSSSLVRAQAQIRRLTSLLNQLLDVGRIDAKRLVIHREPVDLPALVRDVVERFDEKGPRPETPVVIDVQAPVTGSWDRGHLELVVSNLVGNALKYGGEKPVEITIAPLAGGARLIVRDHGIGIAPQDQARIFERYERAAPRSYGGIGIGLWISKQILHLHGGTISVQSTPGEGSSFTVDLPLA